MSKNEQIKELCDVVRGLVEKADDQITDPRVLFALSPEQIARLHRRGRFDTLFAYDEEPSAA